MRVRLLAAILGLMAFAPAPVVWSERQLPKDAHFGEMTRFAYPQVIINQRTFHMAPGARIYNQQNLTIVPAAMPPRAKVLFQLDTAGHLSGVWLLTAQEAARYKKPSTAWTPTPKPAAEPSKDQDTADPSPAGRD
jgi:hypothetical protein